MTSNTHFQPEALRALASARRSITLYGALTATALGAVVVVAATGHTVNTFMWVRAVLLPVIAYVLHRITASAAGGSRRAFDRVSTLAVIMPVAIIGVDLIPGVCPPWYAVTQTLCMLPVIHVAFLTRRTALKAAFPKAG
ncbi:hypothetical protein [Streptomyces drozdowiczii]|uniref:Uncharacterized protein n=1 Tax=Streptomyces drozdowiczii TaxID=202862 RepID=A0ABY6PUR1_9ACTN|nr:hypothetical protein [Streptomyces drozdowiczii]MCX0244371.1 hypothetical protein [Streptomyces drozdowiczii]UZK55841.1 hypothetical protein NEH16_18525 [Streptomyces drozdowiczii]